MTSFSERENEILTRVVETISHYLNPEKITLFGSRAKGHATVGSDFDIAIFAARPHPEIEIKMLDEISSFRGLYTLDLVYVPELDEDFKELIQKTGKIIYDRRS